MTATITLRDRLDFGAAPELKSEILKHVGHDLEVDATAVTHMGTLCLQVLIAASKDWRQSGHHFNLISSSEICNSQLSLHGFSADTLTGATS